MYYPYTCTRYIVWLSTSTRVISPLNAIMAKTAKLYQTRGLTDGGIFAFLIHNSVVMETRGLVLVQFRQVQIDATAFDRTQANFIWKRFCSIAIHIGNSRSTNKQSFLIIVTKNTIRRHNRGTLTHSKTAHLDIKRKLTTRCYNSCTRHTAKI